MTRILHKKYSHLFFHFLVCVETMTRNNLYNPLKRNLIGAFLFCSTGLVYHMPVCEIKQTRAFFHIEMVGVCSDQPKTHFVNHNRSNMHRPRPEQVHTVVFESPAAFAQTLAFITD